MKQMGWVVLALVAVLFVSCSKESSPGPAGPQGAAGATGATGAAGIPRKMFVGRYSTTYYVPNGNQTYRWTANPITLPWTPGTNGVTANFRGFWLSYVGAQNCILDQVTVNGNQVTVSGQVWTEWGGNTLYVYYDVLASDTLNTLMYTDNSTSITGRLVESQMPAVRGGKTNLP